jgi:hypothetical protein
LIDLALATKFRFQGQNRKTVRLGITIATSFADQVIDEHASGWVNNASILAHPAFLGRASLIIDKDTCARLLSKLTLNPVERTTVIDRYPWSEITVLVFIRFVSDNSYMPHPLVMDLP